MGVECSLLPITGTLENLPSFEPLQNLSQNPSTHITLMQTCTTSHTRLATFPYYLDCFVHRYHRPTPTHSLAHLGPSHVCNCSAISAIVSSIISLALQPAPNIHIRRRKPSFVGVVGDSRSDNGKRTLVIGGSGRVEKAYKQTRTGISG